jgi:hypothetical protein
MTDLNGVRTSEVRYKPFGEDRWSYGTTPTTMRYTGQRAEAAPEYWRHYGSVWGGMRRKMGEERHPPNLLNSIIHYNVRADNDSNRMSDHEL